MIAVPTGNTLDVPEAALNEVDGYAAADRVQPEAVAQSCPYSTGSFADAGRQHHVLDQLPCSTSRPRPKTSALIGPSTMNPGKPGDEVAGNRNFHIVRLRTGIADSTQLWRSLRCSGHYSSARCMAIRIRLEGTRGAALRVQKAYAQMLRVSRDETEVERTQRLVAEMASPIIMKRISSATFVA